MIKFRITLGILFTFLVSNSFAQVGFPPSPNAVSLANYAVNPGGLYTGSLSVNIPLYTISSRQLSVPVSINYHGGGIKVEEISSDIGLGWSLNAGGCVTRQVNGLPDESGLGIMNYGKTHIDESGIFDGGWMDEYNEGLIDGMPDNFYFNFLGRCGRIVFDKDFDTTAANKCKYYIFPMQDLKIEPIIDTVDNEIQIIKFIITDEVGTIYTFGDTEYNLTARHQVHEGVSSIRASSLMPPDAALALSQVVHEGVFLFYREYYSTWYLSKIETPDEKDVITFTYEPLAPYSIDLLNSQMFHYPLDGAPAIDDVSYAGQIPTTYENGYTISGKRLTEISAGMNSILFKYSNNLRRDLSFQYIIGSEEYNYYPVPLNYPAPLSEIQLLDNNSQTLKKFVLSQTYSDGSRSELPLNDTSANGEGRGAGFTDYRLILNSITEFSKDTDNNTISIPPYVFTYENDGRLPDRISSRALDYWGYYNGALNYSLIPACTYNGVTIPGTYYRANSRNPNLASAKAGILKKVVYPTGGYSEYTYELNNTTSTLLAGSGNKNVGGLRIASVSTYDGMGHIMTENYSYNDPSTGLSSGKLTGFAKYGYKSQIKDTNGVYHKYFVISSESNYPLATTQGSVVGYEWVTVDKGAMGKMVYRYHTPADAPDEYETYNIDINIQDTFSILNADESLLLPTYTTANIFDWKRGQLKEEYVYNSSGSILNKKIYTYTDNPVTRLSYPFVPPGFMEAYEPSDALYNHYKYYRLKVNCLRRLSSVSEYTYDKDNSSNSTRKNTYYYYESDNHLMPTRITTGDGKGGYLCIKNKYVADYNIPANATIVDLQNKHVISPVIEKLVFEQKSGASINVLSGALMNYSSTNGLYKPYEVYSLETSAPIPSATFGESYPYNGPYTQLNPHSAYYKRKIKYTYDNYYNNLIKTTPENGNTSSIFYDPDYNLLPEMTIECLKKEETFNENESHTIASNTTMYYETINVANLPGGKYKFSLCSSLTGSTAFIEDANDGIPRYPLEETTSGRYEKEIDLNSSSFSGCTAIRIGVTTGVYSIQVKDVHFYPIDAFKTTYTYDKMGNVTSVTDANNRTVSYVYDGLGRLIMTKDNDGNVLNKYDYNYIH